MVPFKFLVFVPGIKKYKPVDEIPKASKYLTISGTQLRSVLEEEIKFLNGLPIQRLH